MTREAWNALSPDEQRIKVAELCGFRDCWEDRSSCLFFRENPALRLRGHHRTPGAGGAVPDYLNDLNAMHEAEKMLTVFRPYKRWLQRIAIGFEGAMSDAQVHRVQSATAAQRAEAFVIAMEGQA